jgi:uncharacterized protein with NAD-binding domain and iron-sulfur cluster
VRHGRGRSTADARARARDALLVNTVSSWEARPDAGTRIGNLFLASDYVRVNVDLATMEGANAAARQAVNALLAARGSPAEPCRMYSLYRPPEFDALKALDRDRFRRGEAHALDVPWPLFAARVRELSLVR